MGHIYSIVPSIFIRKNHPFPIKVPWYFIGNQLTINMWVYFGIVSSVTLIFMSIPVLIPCHLDYL